MQPNTLPLHINKQVSAVGIAPETLFRIGGAGWNYFLTYRVETIDRAWHGKLMECTRSGSLVVNPNIAEALQLSNGDEVSIGVSSANRVQTVEYEIAANAEPSPRVCEGVEIKKGQCWVLQGEAVTFRTSSGIIASDTQWKRLGGEQETGPPEITTLGQNTSSEKSGFARLAGRQQVIEEIEQRLLIPIQQPNLASRYDITPINGALLVGPEGVMKKTVAQAIGEELGWELRWIGSADLFEPAVLVEKFKEAEKAGGNRLIVIEELDQLKFSETGDRRSLAVIYHFLESTSASSNTLTIGLAEQQYPIDQKLQGVGRFEVSISLSKPNRTQRAGLFKQHLLPIISSHSDINYPALADQSEGYTHEDIDCIVRQVKFQAMISAEPQITNQMILEVLTNASQNSCLVNTNNN